MQVNIEMGKVSDFIYTLLTQTKSKKFRAGFMKKDGTYRVGKFDLKYRKTGFKKIDGTMYKFKGKERTTDADEYILAHDLDKKQPRNISVERLLWFSVSKKVYTVSRLSDNDNVNIVMFERVKFNSLKMLMSSKEINANKMLWVMKFLN